MIFCVFQECWVCDSCLSKRDRGILAHKFRHFTRGGKLGKLNKPRFQVSKMSHFYICRSLGHLCFVYLLFIICGFFLLFTFCIWVISLLCFHNLWILCVVFLFCSSISTLLIICCYLLHINFVSFFVICVFISFWFSFKSFVKLCVSLQ